MSFDLILYTQSDLSIVLRRDKSRVTVYEQVGFKELNSRFMTPSRCVKVSLVFSSIPVESFF